jgi:hypothetical protein
VELKLGDGDKECCSLLEGFGGEMFTNDFCDVVDVILPSRRFAVFK